MVRSCGRDEKALPIPVFLVDAIDASRALGVTVEQGTKKQRGHCTTLPFNEFLAVGSCVLCIAIV